jgi:tRNA 2-thiouridine synthesizing protein A
MSYSPDATLDATGLYCPEPVMMLHKQIRELASGGILAVVATDPSTQRDIPKFCAFLGHELLEQSVEADVFYFTIRKQ